jgi:hypothetical protein
MSHPYINRPLSVAHVCALLAVVATLAILVSQGTIGSISPSGCQGAARANTQLAGSNVALGDSCAHDGSSGGAIGYRLP